jgi:phage terminase small subunit
MARKSLESTLAVVTNLDVRRPGLQPPSHLPAAARAIFAEIVASVAPGHLRVCDTPVIAALASSLTIGMKVNPNIAIFERATKSIATLSAKLRITPSSRLDRKIAGTTTRDRGLAAQYDEEAAIAALLDEEDDV